MKDLCSRSQTNSHRVDHLANQVWAKVLVIQFVIGMVPMGVLC